MNIRKLIYIVFAIACIGVASGLFLLNQWGDNSDFAKLVAPGRRPEWDDDADEIVKMTSEERKEAWDKAVAYWKTLKSGEDAVFDKEVTFDAADIEPMITYGTNPGMGIAIDAEIPSSEDMDEASKVSYSKALNYMGFSEGDKMIGKKVDYVFVGSCTNGRIEDLRAFANFVKGRHKAEGVTAWIVPGSKEVERLAIEEGLKDILEQAGFELRQPGCSACLAMNEDKIPAGKYCSCGELHRYLHLRSVHDRREDGLTRCAPIRFCV